VVSDSSNRLVVFAFGDNSGLDFDDPEVGYIQPNKPEIKASHQVSAGLLSCSFLIPTQLILPQNRPPMKKYFTNYVEVLQMPLAVRPPW
jgi:hypothetical protein